MTKNTFTSSKDLLMLDYLNRKKRNPRYSKRTFAQGLGISSGRLSEILEGRAPITVKRALELLPKLHLPEIERDVFLDLVQKEERARTKSLKKRLQAQSCVLGSKMPREKEIFSFQVAVEAKKVRLVQNLFEEFRRRLEKVLGSTTELKNSRRHLFEIRIVQVKNKKGSTERLPS